MLGASRLMSALAAFCKLYVDRGFQSAAEACDALERHLEVYMASCKTVGEGNFEKVDVFNTRGVALERIGVEHVNALCKHVR